MERKQVIGLPLHYNVGRLPSVTPPVFADPDADDHGMASTNSMTAGRYLTLGAGVPHAPRVSDQLKVVSHSCYFVAQGINRQLRGKYNDYSDVISPSAEAFHVIATLVPAAGHE